MNFNLIEAIGLLERMPKSLEQLLSGLSDGWLESREGEGTWNAVEVVDHLIEAERSNWIPRISFLLQEGASKPFPPFDRFSHLKNEPDRSIDSKLQTFRQVRSYNIDRLKELLHTDTNFNQTGLHPEFGEVKLSELISTWVVHDLTHTAQIVRVMAERYRSDVGPWVQYLGILKRTET
ncbi:DinB family protein [Paenibacillus taihuensis]|nr:DinB family protein [Paenibacillus taihuensis]